MVRRVPSEAEDPMLGEFLTCLERDIREHPERLQPIDKALQQRIDDLVGGIEVDLDAPLSASDE